MASERELGSILGDDDLQECPRCGDFRSVELFDDVAAPDGLMWFVCQDCTDAVESEGMDSEEV